MPTKSNRKKILLLSDSIRGTTGVGRMAGDIVHNNLDKFNWIHLSPEIIQSSQLTKLDMSQAASKHTGVVDAELCLIPYHNFGDINVLRLMIHTEHIDAILIFQDPRYWKWLFEHEREIRQLVPIIFYNIWDNYPIPYYNKPLYESVDSLIAISQLTEKINLEATQDSELKPYITRVPHGVDPKIFFPIEVSVPYHQGYNIFKQNLVGNAEFVLFYNSRNQDRKNVMGIIEAFDRFLNVLKVTQPDVSKVKLLLHTNPVDQVGSNLLKYVDQQIKNKENIVWSSNLINDIELNYLYNIADATISLSYNEGWGLSVTESIMAGTPVIAIATGGVTEQMKDIDNDRFGDWAYPLLPEVRSLLGNIETPYIYTDRVRTETVVQMLKLLYDQRDTLEEKGKLGRAYFIKHNMTTIGMANGVAAEITRAIENFEPRTNYDIIKI